MGDELGINLAEQFTVYSGDVRTVSICSDIALFTTRDISTIADGVLHIYQKFLKLCGPNRLKWYSTENMSHHKPVTARVFDMLPGWLASGAPKRPVIHIHLKDGDQYADASIYSFWIWGNEAGEARYGIDTNVIRCAFSSDMASTDPRELLSFAQDMCEQIPFDSGLGGLCLQTTQYKQEDSETAAWKIAIQHPGLDISNVLTDSVAIQRDGLKGVNWLTIMGESLLESIGGLGRLRSKLPETIELVKTKYGLIIVAGVKPKIGFVNRRELLPDYQSVYRVVQPLQERILGRYSAFDLPGGGHREKTRQWLRRFADGD